MDVSTKRHIDSLLAADAKGDLISAVIVYADRAGIYSLCCGDALAAIGLAEYAKARIIEAVPVDKIEK